MKIATLLTCHNRKKQTLACLEALYQNRLPRESTLDVFLVDDGSTDGTEQAVRDLYPQVNVITGDGKLYWNGGMRVAFAAALEKGFDYYLWLNDDTLLKPEAIHEMLETAPKDMGIIVGSCQDPVTGTWTYGGRSTPHGGKSLTGTPVIPSNAPQRCQQMNGNVVLVPHTVVERIGILSEKYTHAIGDFDYGFRALDAGISLIIPPHYQATCSANPLSEWCNPATPLRKRLALFIDPKGINFPEFMVFCYRHFGIKCILTGSKVLIRLFLPRLWLKKAGNRA